MREYITSRAIGGTSGWAPPADWQDISNCADNEILMLATDGAAGVAFTVGMSSGTYSIDWGDGTVETGVANNAVKSHSYNGIGGVWCSLGYNTYKIRVYGAANNISTFKFQKSVTTSFYQAVPVLSISIGARYITDYSATFYSASYRAIALRYCKISSFQACSTALNMFNGCYSLTRIDLPGSWGNVTTTSYMFSGCSALFYLTLPSSWGNVTDVTYMLNGCYSLPALTLPSSWGNVTQTGRMLQNCYSLPALILPSSWGNVANIDAMFSGDYSLLALTLPSSWGSVNSTNYLLNNCYSLAVLTLPGSWGNIDTAGNMLSGCVSLRLVNNLQYFGSQSLQCDFSSFMTGCTLNNQAIEIAAKLAIFGMNGSSGAGIIKTTSIRLTNPGSTFTGSSPQINISYTSLNAAALDLLFGDLPTLTGKYINITGCPGASTCTRSIATAKGWSITG